MAFEIAKPASRPAPTTKAKKQAVYLTFLHRLPCSISGVYGVQCAHVSFCDPWHGAPGRGKGTKVSDRFALPLSPELHELQHSGKMGREEEFWAKHGINPHSLANTLWGLWCDYGDMAEDMCEARIRQGIQQRGNAWPD